MSSDVNTLIEMGFPQNRAEKALHKTGYKGAQVAMDWLFDHQDDPDIDDPFEAPQGHVLGKEAETTEATTAGTTGEAAPNSSAEPQAEPEQAKSLKCEDCGKLIRSELDAQAHAARTGHANFSESTEEIKPLTEEEKRAKVEQLQERIREKRAEKQEQDKKDQVQREKLRRAAGKDMSQVKQRMEEMEMKKLAEEKRREKEEARLARQKVREDIERDKRERAAKFAKKGGATEGGAAASGSGVPPAPAAQTQEAPPKKEYDQCRLQIRLPSGTALTQTFGAREELAAVRLFVQMKLGSDGGAAAAEPFALMTSFPRKVFADEDMEKPLLELGLVPSAVLIVTKKH